MMDAWKSLKVVSNNVTVQQALAPENTYTPEQ